MATDVIFFTRLYVSMLDSRMHPTDRVKFIFILYKNKIKITQVILSIIRSHFDSSFGLGKCLQIEVKQGRFVLGLLKLLVS